MKAPTYHLVTCVCGVEYYARKNSFRGYYRAIQWTCPCGHIWRISLEYDYLKEKTTVVATSNRKVVKHDLIQRTTTFSHE